MVYLSRWRVRHRIFVVSTCIDEEAIRNLNNRQDDLVQFVAAEWFVLEGEEQFCVVRHWRLENKGRIWALDQCE